MNAIHVEQSSKHNESLESGEDGSQHIDELERCLEVVVNMEKF